MAKGDLAGIVNKRQPKKVDADFIDGAANNDAKPKPKRKAKPEQNKRLNVNVPESKYFDLKVKAAKERKDISTLVNAWINDYLSK